MKRIATWVLIGAGVMPIIFLTFCYGYGLASRHDGMSMHQVISMINDATLNWTSFRDDVLSIWMPIGGAIGAVGSILIKGRKKQMKTS